VERTRRQVRRDQVPSQLLPDLQDRVHGERADLPVKSRENRFVRCAFQDPNLTLPITDDEIRQQIESLIDQAMILPIDRMQQGIESEPDALGVKYSTSAEPVEDLVNKDQETLGGIWKITVQAAWEEAGEQQKWKEEFLRYQP
jgi:hypothetical protein